MVPPRRNGFSTVHSNTAAKVKTVAMDGESRSPSITLTGAREMRARWASSDQWRTNRRASTKLNVMIMSTTAIIMAFQTK